MIYKYLNIRYDSRYSKAIKTESVIKLIEKIDCIQRKGKIQFENKIEYPWLVLSLIKCNEKGNFSFNGGDYFEEINLIELIIVDNEESISKYQPIAKQIAKQIDWEVIDDHKDE